VNRLTARSWLWISRGGWGLAGTAAVLSVDAATDGRSTAVAVAASIVLWLVVGGAVTALVVPSAISLTVLRMLAPLAVVGAVVAWSAGAGLPLGAFGTVATLLNALVVASGDVGEAYVQASAYGDERRFLLRPPLALVAPVAVTWLVWAAAVLAGPLLIGAARPVAGIPVTAVAVALTWLLLPRFHRLSRRWLVLVPAGLVVHDHVVLAETQLVQRHNLVGVHLALVDTGAADLTGPCAGHALEVTLREMATVVTTPARRGERGRALHVGAFLVAPTRPGRALQAAADHRLPVR
jgi:hypothetical protein